MTTSPDRTGTRCPVEVKVVMGLAPAHSALLLVVGALILVGRRNAEVADALNCQPHT